MHCCVPQQPSASHDSALASEQHVETSWWRNCLWTPADAYVNSAAAIPQTIRPSALDLYLKASEGSSLQELAPYRCSSKGYNPNVEELQTYASHSAFPWWTDLTPEAIFG